MHIFDTHQPITKDVMQQVTTYLTTLPEQQRTTVMEVHVEIRTNIGYQVSIISLPDGQRHRTEVEIPAANDTATTTPDADDQGERFDVIAAKQGWDEAAQLHVMRRFVVKKGEAAALAEWAADVAAFENTGGESAWGR